MKNIWNENSLGRMNNYLDIVEEKIGKLEDVALETVQMK